MKSVAVIFLMVALGIWAWGRVNAPLEPALQNVTLYETDQEDRLLENDTGLNLGVLHTRLRDEPWRNDSWQGDGKRRDDIITSAVWAPRP